MGDRHAPAVHRFQSTLPTRGATPWSKYKKSSPDFNPRSPRGERREDLGANIGTPIISIHAPHAGSDRDHKQTGDQRGDFNPRSPRGERQVNGEVHYTGQIISIHAPHAGSDSGAGAGSLFSFLFQSTLPTRGATIVVDVKVSRRINFNPRSPRGERLDYTLCITVPHNFNPRSPRGERPAPKRLSGFMR